MPSLVDVTYTSHTLPAVDAPWLNMVNRFANDAQSPTGRGSGLITFLGSGVGAVPSDLEARGRLTVWAEDYGHSPAASGAVNDAALVKAMTAVAAAGGGDVRMGCGTFRHITSVFALLTSVGVNLRGASTTGTVLMKEDLSITPLLDLSQSALVLDTYATYSDFSVVGSGKSGSGIRATLMARCKTLNLKITGCDVGLDLVGSLIWDHHNLNSNSNNIGVRTRKSGAVYANLHNFFGGAMRANSAHGLDLGEGSGHHFYGTDIEQNGTVGDVTTGNVVIRSTVDDEDGYSQITFHGGWCEASNGSNFVVEAASGLALVVLGTVMANAEAHLSMVVGAIQSLTLVGIQAGSPGDTVTTAAVNSTIIGGVINLLVDTASSYVHLGVTNNGPVLNEMKGAAAVAFGSTGISLAADAPFKRIAGKTAGTAVLSGGAKTVLTSAVTANSMVFVECILDGGTPGWLRVSAVNPGVSFVVNSSSGADTSTFAWMVVEKA